MSYLGLEVVFQCRDEGLLRAPVKWTRPGGRPLPPGSKDVQGRLEIPNIRVSVFLISKNTFEAFF